MGEVSFFFWENRNEWAKYPHVGLAGYTSGCVVVVGGPTPNFDRFWEGFGLLSGIEDPESR